MAEKDHWILQHDIPQLKELLELRKERGPGSHHGPDSDWDHKDADWIVALGLGAIKKIEKYQTALNDIAKLTVNTETDTEDRVSAIAEEALKKEA